MVSSMRAPTSWRITCVIPVRQIAHATDFNIGTAFNSPSQYLIITLRSAAMTITVPTSPGPK
jgi:hypothetical protein